jgi:hypothetical protein
MEKRILNLSKFLIFGNAKLNFTHFRGQVNNLVINVVVGL